LETIAPFGAATIDAIAASAIAGRRFGVIIYT